MKDTFYKLFKRVGIDITAANHTPKLGEPPKSPKGCKEIGRDKMTGNILFKFDWETTYRSRYLPHNGPPVRYNPNRV